MSERTVYCVLFPDGEDVSCPVSCQASPLSLLYCHFLCYLCVKATIALQSQLHNMEAMKAEMDVTDDQLEDWVTDVNDWAEGIVYSLLLPIMSPSHTCTPLLPLGLLKTCTCAGLMWRHISYHVAAGLAWPLNMMTF